MKKLGLIGGVGPEATLQYYKEIEYGVMKKLGKPVLPEITIESLNCFKMIPFGATQDYEGMTEYILGAVRTLEKANCDFIALACCTGHMVFDRVARETAIPMLSLVQVCVSEAKKKKFNKLLLLGTEGTMKDTYFKEPFEKEGIQVVTPSEEDCKWIGWHIENELEHGVITKDTKDKFIEIANKGYSDLGVDAIILGCTELPMVYGDVELKIPTLDATKIHIQNIIDEILI